APPGAARQIPRQSVSFVATLWRIVACFIQRIDSDTRSDYTEITENDIHTVMIRSDRTCQF
ncbi:hypothetical protein, partial [Anaerotruncus massiliensis (ex Liu et al. 2021)]|uniref:hypothetical protein n=1 Tax=Anaerotruncus massiliensis (ex Liu et al. 2021) TaxID=2321404 RepID=UPI003AB6DD23